MADTQTFNVVVYRDLAKTELLEVVAIEDIGVVRAGRMESSGNDVLIHLAQTLLREGGDANVSSYFYTVERTS